MKKVTATYLRQHVYALLDQVLDSGKPLTIERNGRQLQVVPAPAKPAKRKRLADLVERDDIIVGDFDDLVRTDWSKEWKP